MNDKQNCKSQIAFKTLIYFVKAKGEKLVFQLTQQVGETKALR